MKNVTITKHITLNLTAEDWDLYTCMDNIEYVAKDLNTHVSDIFNSNDAPTAFTKASAVLEEYSEFGAADSEPRQVLYELHDLFFADELQQDFRCV
jgi:hypothetical protein